MNKISEVYLEKELIKRCRQNDGSAFTFLLNPYKQKLYGYLWRMCGNTEQTDELFQETIIKVWTGLKSYKESNRFSSWLFTIAHNVALDSLRKDKNNRILFVENDKLEYSDNLTAHQILVAKELNETINKTVEALPEKQKQVFLLRQHGEMTFREIADLMNEPISTVLSHMHYAVNKLKKELREEHVK